ncbi:RrF2 family transcriptional regulator [Phytohabitans suffuscus]|uniref:RrF2 family transcriptional regulator n=1 Tax=Phytohabitans suffuscus TaxID=624315 RepID=UPI001E457CD4|nr:Rrf2 family transcriptional regulator [Phytohabitans suffuscus]
MVYSRRGTDGGYVLAKEPDQISVGDILRTVGGSWSSVRGMPAEKVTYWGAAAGLPALWSSVHSAIVRVVDQTTVSDLLAGRRHTWC